MIQMFPSLPRSMKRAARNAAGVVFLALLATPTFAQDSGGDVTSSPTGWVFRWLNFGIVFCVIVWGFSKAAPAFRRKAEEISQKIAEGARAREAAEAQRRAVQKKLARVDEEVAQLRADSKRAAEAETQRIRALAKDEAQLVERAGQAEVAAAEHAARMELRALAGKLAVERAEAMLRDQMNPQTEAAVFRAFVETLQESRN